MYTHTALGLCACLNNTEYIVENRLIDIDINSVLSFVHFWESVTTQPTRKKVYFH